MSFRILWIFAAIIRLWNLPLFSYTNDELSSITRADFNSLGELFREGIYTDVHPAGVQVFLYYWTGWFGHHEWIVRLPFAIAGIFSVVLFTHIARRFFTDRAALAATACMAFLAFPVEHSQYVRPYAFGLFGVMFLAWVWCRIVFDNKRSWKWYALMTGAGAFCLYAHYFAGLSAALIAISGFVFLRSKSLLYYTLAWLGTALLFLPHLPLTFMHLGIGGIGGEEGWLGPPSPSFFREFFLYAFNGSEVLLFIPVVFILVTLSQKASTQGNRFRWICLLWAVTPAIFGYWYSVEKNPILQPRALLFSFPFMVLFAFSFAGEAKNMAGRIITLVFCAVLFVHTLWVFDINKDQQEQGSFGEISTAIHAYGKMTGGKEPVVLADVHSNRYLELYLHDLDDSVRILNIHELLPGQIDSLMGTIGDSPIIRAWEMFGPHLETSAMARDMHPVLRMATYYRDAGAELYTDSGEEFAKIMLDSRQQMDEPPADHWGFSSDHLVDTFSPEGKRPFGYRKGEPFGPAFETKLGDLQPGDFVHISAWVYLHPGDDAHLSLALSGNDKEQFVAANPVQSFRVREGGWRRAFVSIRIPEGWTSDDTLKGYVWNRGETEIFVDGFHIVAERIPSRIIAE
ncbi:MAG: glycosyltransferase family 39 protein [Flavobacteriales bacterium]|nr:glycosyltransferase family 39 protein [Flavobacteriales bacterium]